MDIPYTTKYGKGPVVGYWGTEDGKMHASRHDSSFRYSTRNEAMGCTALAHRNDFCIDESGMKSAIRAFAAFVLEYGK